MDLSGTGGGARGAGAGKGELWKAIEAGGSPTAAAASGASKKKEGWQMLGPRELMTEVERQAFKALTGRRMG